MDELQEEQQVKKQTVSDTVKFNVGGRLFEMLRVPTLAHHPNSVLSQLAEDHDAPQPIFVEASPDLFQFIVDYHRHNQVHIPVTVTVAALLREAEVLGVPLTSNDIVQEAPPLGKMLALTAEVTKDRNDQAHLSYYRSTVDLLGQLIIKGFKI